MSLFAFCSFAYSLLVAGLVFVLMELGRRSGARRRDEDPGASLGISTLDTSVFALLGLLIAFTFSGAASRFDARRQLIGVEANAIGTAWMRIDLFPQGMQPAMRKAFRQYTDARLAMSSVADSKELPTRYAGDVAKAQAEIWKLAVDFCLTDAGRPYNVSILSALNEMFDCATTRNVAALIHPPMIVIGMLTFVALVCAYLAGTGMGGLKSRSLVHMIGFSAILGLTIYIILDLEFPRLGYIQIRRADNVMKGVRANMDAPQFQAK